MWEYDVLLINDDKNIIIEVLNAMGQNDWELVSVSPVNKYIFKRKRRVHKEVNLDDDDL